MRLALVTVLLLVCGHAEAQAVRVTDRWEGELPESGFSEWPDQVYSGIWDGEGRRIVLLSETGFSDPVDLGHLPDPFSSEGCERLEDEPSVEGRLWLRCAAVREHGDVHLLARHDDGEWLIAYLMSDTPTARAVVRSLRPRLPDHPCEETCDIGPGRWLTVRAEPGRRLGYVVEVGMDVDEGVVEVTPPGERCLAITWSRHHHRAPDPKRTTVSRKVWLRGRPIPAFASNDRWVLDFAAASAPTVVQRLVLWGRTPNDLERAIRMVEAAAPGPGWVEHDGLRGVRSRLPKAGPERDEEGRGLPIVLAVGAAAFAVGLWWWRSRRRRSPE
ncbi:MAG: hypothetical protein KC619_12950 [Myxococcales bacterium]|nr:hypothetical protein [Myxococcales bacterium]